MPHQKRSQMQNHISFKECLHAENTLQHAACMRVTYVFLRIIVTAKPLLNNLKYLTYFNHSNLLEDYHSL